MFKIMVIEDDEILKEQICSRIIQWGYEAVPNKDFSNIMGEFNSHCPHLLLLDINLPVKNGFNICEEIRKVSEVPIIFISSRNSNMDIITGINSGADDFIQKPFSLDVLIAKIEGLLRRTYEFTDNSSTLMTHGGVVLDLSKSCITYEGNAASLTSNELKIVHELLKNKGHVISRDRLMEKLWNESWFVDDSTLTVNINRIRAKLKTIGLEDFIETKRGQGYLIGD